MRRNALKLIKCIGNAVIAGGVGLLNGLPDCGISARAESFGFKSRKRPQSVCSGFRKQGRTEVHS